MQKKFYFLTMMFTVISLWLAFSQPASAQESDYGINLRRDFGYGAGSTVRGTFTISLAGDESQVSSVEFLIDGEVLAKVTSAPFKFQFHTDDYGIGIHQLGALVILDDGSVETTKTASFNFISKQDERSSIVAIFAAIGGAILLGLVIFWLVQSLVIKKKPVGANAAGSPRSYGMLGATICPKCGRPFSRHIWGFNLVVGKLDRCEHCGKWSMTTQATPEALRAAEEAELAAQPQREEITPRLSEVKDALDESKYTNEL